MKLDDLPWDPSDRPTIHSYDPNIIEEIRRMYWDRGPCQPKGHKFSTKMVGTKKRCFVVTWFSEFRCSEYSVKKTKAYCLCCYLFRNHGAGDAFTLQGFDSWSKKTSLKDHVGELNSFHNKALQKCENQMKKNQSISAVFNKQTEQEMSDYRILLYLSVKTCGFLLKGGCPFRGRDESISSLNRGMFLELYQLLANENEETRLAVARAPLNCTLTSFRWELDLYYETVIHDIDFMKLKGIPELATLMVTRMKHISFPLIYKLLKLSLVLPVATATVKRCFSEMKLIKTNLRNIMGENYMNDALICNMEKELFVSLQMKT